MYFANKVNSPDKVLLFLLHILKILMACLIFLQQKLISFSPNKKEIHTCREFRKTSYSQKSDYYLILYKM